MQRSILLVATLVASVFASPGMVRAADAPQDDRVAFRIRFGIKDQEGQDWSGTITPSSGKVDSITGWRWMPGDHASGNSFTVMSRRQAPQNAGDRQRVRSGGRMPMIDNGIVVSLSGTRGDDTVTFDSKPGKFQFKNAELPFGKKLMELDGNVEVMRIPPASELVGTDADEDYPALAVAKDGTMYVAYLAFTHGKDFMGARERPMTPESSPQVGPLAQGKIKKLEKPEDFDYLAQPTGGEQIFLRVCKNGGWGDPIAVTDGKLELYRPAVAVDGSGKVWVVYSAHVDAGENLDKGDWELMARSFDAYGKAAGDAINISNSPGTDFMPAAATDSNGKVTITWVGARKLDFNVFVAAQDGEKFSAPKRVSDSEANEWEPSIAADANGHVAVAWDTYAKGDYDVCLTTRGTDGTWSKPQPVAATLAFEVRPTIAYDNTGKLWIAWEESGDQWGKDFGALKKKGIPLYNGGRAIAVKALTADGQWMSPPDVMDCMPVGTPGRAANRPAIHSPRMANPVAPCFPRITCDPKGEVYLAFRGRPGGNWRVAVGGVWCEYVTRLDGDTWSTAAWVPRSNHTLDNRPAIAAPSADGATIVFAGDGRGELNPPRVGDPHLRGSADGDDQVQLAMFADAPGATDDAAGANDNPTTAPSDEGGGRRRRRRQEAAASATTEPAGESATPGPADRGSGGGRGTGVLGINSDLFTAFVRASDFPAAAEAKLATTQPAKPAEPSPDTESERKAIQAIRDYRVNLNGENLRIWRGEFHRHTEYSPDGGGDGGLLDMWRYAIDAAGLDWIGDGDHDYGNGREYTWWTTQKAVTLFTVADHFTPVFSYERSVSYPEGHRNCMFAQRGVRSLPRLPISDPEVLKPAPDTNMLYMYLKRFHGLTAPHTSGTDMGTDWRNYDPEVEPFVEIYQGDRNNYERPDAPRSYYTEAKLKQSTPEKEAIGGFRPKGMVNLALLMGRKYAFEASSDHVSTHLSYCNVFLTDPTRENILDAVRKKRVYGATDNIIADVRCKAGDKEHFMGEEFATNEPPTLNIHIIGAQKIAKVTIIKDDKEAKVFEPNEQDVKLTWSDPEPTAGKSSYYYVRGEQVPDMEGVSSGEIVWASPMWITYNK